VTAWQQLAEVGSLGALRAMSLWYRVVGRRASAALLAPIAGYFTLRHGRVRSASRAYLDALAAHPGGAAALGGPPAARHAFRHVHEFALQLFDRMVSWGDSFDRMELEKEGSRALLDLARAGRGGILVGAHLGSFDLLRLVAAQHEVRVNVLMFTAHADRINAFFEWLDPRSRLRVLPIDPSSASTALAVRHCVERGEWVGILADRVPPGGAARSALVPFLGRPAPFPTTAFELATLLGCPLLLALCVRLGDARYASIAEVLYEGGRVERSERPARTRELLERYVARLEAWCVQAPYQWFNFYDFWQAPAGALAAPAASAPASSSTSVPASPRRT
jgi:predicted LPLAT superfamily acyltransferase